MADQNDENPTEMDQSVKKKKDDLLKNEKNGKIIDRKLAELEKRYNDPKKRVSTVQR